MARRRRRRKSTRKTRLGRFFQKIGKGVKKIVKKAASIPFAPLLPFKLAMKKILKSKGVDTSGDTINEIVQKFYHVVIQKKGNFEVHSYEHLSPSVVSTIIKAVINFFKSLKARKESGAPLSRAEEKALDYAEKATSEAVQEVKREAKVEIMNKSYLPIIGIALGLVVILVIAMNKKK